MNDLYQQNLIGPNSSNRHNFFTLNFSFLMHVTYPIFMAFTNSLSQMIKNLVTGDMNLHIYINVAIIKLRVL